MSIGMTDERASVGAPQGPLMTGTDLRLGHSRTLVRDQGGVRSRALTYFPERSGTEERAMSSMVKILLRRSLLTLSAIFVWAKALAGGSAETDKKTAGGQEQKPDRER